MRAAEEGGGRGEGGWCVCVCVEGGGGSRVCTGSPCGGPPPAGRRARHVHHRHLARVVPGAAPAGGRGSGGGGEAGFPQEEYDAGVSSLKRKMQTAIAKQAFEKCAAIRDQTSELEGLKAKYDGGDKSARQAILDFVAALDS